MAANKQMTANELVVVLAGLLQVDVEDLARVGNLPVENLRSWLAGKKGNLRLSSIKNLLSLLGLDVGTGKIRLASDRVHFWTLRDPTLRRSRGAYGRLSSVSKLLAGCSITRVAPGKRSIAERLTRSRYLLSGTGVRVVIVVEKGVFKSGRVGPEVVKGAAWRDDNDSHVIPIADDLWGRLVERDMTTFEFDRAFNEVVDRATWGDVSLIAREFGVVPSDVARWIGERYAAPAAATHSDDAGMDLESGGGALRLLLGGGAQDADRYAA